MDEAAAVPRRRSWDAWAAIVASLIGLLALGVSGYTAYVQRQQVRAQVWPWLVAGNEDNDHSVAVYNKGVGPAIVRSVQIFVDGRPQTDWDTVLDALGIGRPHEYEQATINPNVLSPGEHVTMIRFSDDAVWKTFRKTAVERMAMDICFCSTLDECWMYSDRPGREQGQHGARESDRAMPACRGARSLQELKRKWPVATHSRGLVESKWRQT
ncbi:MAG: hypothetical protein ACREPX_04390 [Rhodanobacteraceae bacterium]